MEFCLTLPTALTQAGDILALCEGKVLRVEPHDKEGISGVAVRIDALTFIETPSDTADGMMRAGES